MILRDELTNRNDGHALSVRATPSVEQQHNLGLPQLAAMRVEATGHLPSAIALLHRRIHSAADLVLTDEAAEASASLRRADDKFRSADKRGARWHGPDGCGRSRYGRR